MTDIPTIYQPHDLQHLHVPRFFTRREVEIRERDYRIHCNRAKAVVVMTRWGKEDLVRQYQLPPEKVHIIPWAPVLSAYAPLSETLIENVSMRNDLPLRFAFYPAKTYPHKNHIALLDAIAILRDQGLHILLVCTGSTTDFHSNIRSRIERLRLEAQVRFLGFIPASEMRALYARAHCLIFPSLFEGWGMPIFEAFASRLPVACSNIPVLEEVAGKAAITFDPEDPYAIATALKVVWEEEDVRAMLRVRAEQRIHGASWLATARHFRALYRSVAGAPLSADDIRLLDAST